MRLLLDTHALLWWLSGDESLSLQARRAIANEENTTAVSAVSAYEIALKYRLGRLPEAAIVVPMYEDIIDRQGFARLSVSSSHALRAGGLPLTHRDPFDRLLISQALSEDMTLVSIESLFDDFGVRRLW